jgi:hypothetical protein
MVSAAENSAMVKNLVRTALGVGVMLAWWTLRGDNVETETASQIPNRVWEGGAGTLSIEVDASTPSTMRASFGEHDEGRSLRSMETWQEVAAGHHSFTIDVPAGVGGYIELGAVAPEPGDTLSWTLSAGGEVVDEQSETLEQPLEKGYAFFIQAYFDDYATGTLGDD